MLKKLLLCLCALAFLAGARAAPVVSPWIADYYGHHKMLLPVVYKTIDGRPLKLALFIRNVTSPAPVLVYIHGGAWSHGTENWEIGHILPWMEMGFSVVSVEYRLSGQAHAPAAVEDCVDALHWVANHAVEEQFDMKRLVIAGASAGAHLALLVGMAPPSAGFDRTPDDPAPRPAAIVSLSGIPDVADLLSGPHFRQSAVDWIGSAKDVALAKRVSPITYVRAGLPPILMIHGDQDPNVPYGQVVRLHQALDRDHVSNQLVTIVGGKHGGWRPEEYILTYQKIGEFLEQHHLAP